jgi:hypothetical protein
VDERCGLEALYCGGCDADATVWETRFHVIREGLKTTISANSPR